MSHAFKNIAGEYILEFTDGVFIDASKVAELKKNEILQSLERTCDCDKSNPALIIHRCENRFAIALIKGENK